MSGTFDTTATTLNGLTQNEYGNIVRNEEQSLFAFSQKKNFYRNLMNENVNIQRNRPKSLTFYMLYCIIYKIYDRLDVECQSVV